MMATGYYERLDRQRHDEIRDKVDKIIQILETFRQYDNRFSLSEIISFLYIARDEGLNLKDLSSKAGLGMANASLIVATLGKQYGKTRKRSMGLVSAVEDPLERRKKILSLTIAGQTFLENLLFKYDRYQD